MLPEGLSRALHEKETPVLKLDGNRVAVTFAFMPEGKLPFRPEGQRSYRGILSEGFFVVAVPPIPSLPSWYKLQRHELNKHPALSSTCSLSARNSAVHGSAILVVPE